MSDGISLDPDQLPSEMRKPLTLAANSTFKSVSEAATRCAEKRMIESALASNKQNRTRAAIVLGISRRTLQNKIKEFDL